VPQLLARDHLERRGVPQARRYLRSGDPFRPYEFLMERSAFLECFSLIWVLAGVAALTTCLGEEAQCYSVRRVAFRRFLHRSALPADGRRILLAAEIDAATISGDDTHNLVAEFVQLGRRILARSA